MKGKLHHYSHHTAEDRRIVASCGRVQSRWNEPFATPRLSEVTCERRQRHLVRIANDLHRDIPHVGEVAQLCTLPDGADA